MKGIVLKVAVILILVLGMYGCGALNDSSSSATLTADESSALSTLSGKPFMLPQ